MQNWLEKFVVPFVVWNFMFQWPVHALIKGVPGSNLVINNLKFFIQVLFKSQFLSKFTLFLWNICYFVFVRFIPFPVRSVLGNNEMFFWKLSQLLFNSFFFTIKTRYSFFCIYSLYLRFLVQQESKVIENIMSFRNVKNSKIQKSGSYRELQRNLKQFEEFKRI